MGKFEEDPPHLHKIGCSRVARATGEEDILPPPERHDTDEETGRRTGKRPDKRKGSSPNTFSGDGRANPTHEET